MMLMAMSQQQSQLTVSSSIVQEEAVSSSSRSPIELVGYTETGYLIGLAVLLVTVVLPLFLHALKSKVFARSSSSSSSHQN
jgi:hypothetical protein